LRLADTRLPPRFSSVAIEKAVLCPGITIEIALPASAIAVEKARPTRPDAVARDGGLAGPLHQLAH